MPGDTMPNADDLDEIVILVRHGQTALNAAGLLRGRLDAPLDEIGRLEVTSLALELARWLGPRRPVRVLSSPLRRAVETAEAIAIRAHASLLEFDDRLIDRDYGPWAGHAVTDVEAQAGPLDRVAAIEPAEAVASRAYSALAAQLPLRTPVVLVAHDAVNRLLMERLEPTLGPAKAIPQRTACWNLLRHRADDWAVLAVDRKPPAQPGATS